MDKAYNHKTSEDKIYQYWEDSGLMKADENSEKPPFTIPLPPPNVTGELHLGHAAMLAIQDIMIRYKRMTGHEVLWLPGTDHAAIATENVVIKHHGKKSREDWPSREAFMKDAATFATQKHDNIVNQMKKMGSWLDWSREAYTFDEDRNLAVNKIFKDLYEDGLIERGHRMINWSVGAQSVLADDELEFEDGTAPFYYIRCGDFVIGTVRSETKCADSPLMLHGDAKYVKIQSDQNIFIISEFLFQNSEKFDEVFNLIEETHQDFKVMQTYAGKELEGQEFEYETYAGKRKFKVLCDNDVIDPEKGSGSMTISANHSPDDYGLAKRLKLDEYFIEKINFEGKMTAIAGECEGFEVAKARNVSGKIMKEKDLLVGIDPNYSNRVPKCYRSGCVVEPMISPQWFILVEKEYEHVVDGKTTLKKQMSAAIKNKHTELVPARFEKEYDWWLNGLQDWCISRQIWWGHRIPVWYDEDGKIVATGFLTPEQEKLNLRQDEDTLDTWFSSALWPFSTLGWPDKKNPDFSKFYPTNVLETGWDILFFWVARMIMFGRYATGKYPFETVYLHGMVTDEKGKKMSKSKGNGIDPLEMISEFGTDPVRLALVIGSSPGNPIPIGKNKIKGYRNFVNKLWNATRFVNMQTDGTKLEKLSSAQILKQVQDENLSLADNWILSRLTTVSDEVSQHLEKYEISTAGDKIYHFVWDEFCDWYLESSKIKLNPMVLKFTLGEILKLTHPLCPFITEKLWQENFKKEGSLMTEAFPKLDFKNQKSETEFINLQNLITQIRSLRAEKKLNPKEKLLVSTSIQSQEIKDLLQALAGINFGETDKEAVILIEANLEVKVQVPVDENRQTKEIEEIEKNISALKGRLSNKAYTEKAPAHLVQQTQDELNQAEETLKKLS